MPLRIVGFALVILGAIAAIIAVVAAFTTAPEDAVISWPALLAGLSLAIFLEIAGALVFHIGMRPKEHEHPDRGPGPMA